MFKSWGTVTFRDGNHLFEDGIKLKISFKIKPPLTNCVKTFKINNQDRMNPPNFVRNESKSFFLKRPGEVAVELL